MKTSMKTALWIIIALGVVFAIYLIFFGYQNPLADTAWTLESYGPPGDLQTVPFFITSTAVFDEDGTGISGSAGCNLFSGDVTVRGDKITTENLSWTLMACYPEESMEVEYYYMRILEKVERFEVEEDELTLYAENGQVLVFIPYDPLTDFTWLLIYIGQPDDLQAIPPDINVTLLFNRSLTEASGYSGCNNYTVEIEVLGDSMSAGEIDAQAFAGCALKLEGDYLSLLLFVERFEIQDGQLTLYAADGQVLVFKRE